MKVAQNYKGQVTFAVSNKDKFSAEVEDYGLSPKGDKPVVAAKNAAGQKFNMKEEFRFVYINQNKSIDIHIYVYRLKAAHYF